MSARITMATAWRILLQLRHDHRTVGLLIGVPSVLMILLRYVINNPLEFDRFGPMLLGVFPFVVMFVVTSVATLRERSTGTLERLMTTPLGKLDLLAGYAIAFGVTALVQVAVVATISLTWLGRVQMSGFLHALSDVLPMSYAVEAMQQLTGNATVTGTLRRDLLVIPGFTVAALAVGAATLRRRTP